MARGVFWGMELSHAPLRSESENFTLDAWLSHKKFRKWWLIYQKNKYCPPPPQQFLNTLLYMAIFAL